MADDQVMLTASRAEAPRIQDLLRALSRLSVSGDLSVHMIPGVGLCLTGGGKAHAPPARKAGLEAVRMRVQSVSEDHLVCRTWKGGESGTVDILVAKPWELRKTGWDGQTIDGITYTYSSGTARSATDGVDTENQVITSPYTVSGGYVDIVAIRYFQGGTDVTVANKAVEWLDLNLAARAWAVEC
jgi:hypothetical protein